MTTDAITIDANDLTIAEAEEMGELMEQGVKMARALVFLIMRRDNPDFTLDDAGKVRIGAVEFSTEMDPTNGDASKSAPPSVNSGA